MFSTPKKSKIPQYRSSPRTPTVKDKVKSCSTPLKLLLPKCVVCAKSLVGHYTLLHSSTGVKKGLSQLLLKYGGVNVTQGMICSPDQEKLLNLEKRVASFREQCQETIKGSFHLISTDGSHLTVSEWPEKNLEWSFITIDDKSQVLESYL